MQATKHTMLSHASRSLWAHTHCTAAAFVPSVMLLVSPYMQHLIFLLSRQLSSMTVWLACRTLHGSIVACMEHACPLVVSEGCK